MTCNKCRVQCDVVWYEVELCPLHSAAEEMLRALKLMYAEFEHVARNSYCNSDDEDLSDDVIREQDPDGFEGWLAARKAILSAEGKENQS